MRSVGPARIVRVGRMPSYSHRAGRTSIWLRLSSSTYPPRGKSLQLFLRVNWTKLLLDFPFGGGELVAGQVVCCTWFLLGSQPRRPLAPRAASNIYRALSRRAGRLSKGPTPTGRCFARTGAKRLETHPDRAGPFKGMAHLLWQTSSYAVAHDTGQPGLTSSANRPPSLTLGSGFQNAARDASNQIA
jgi:hypothetical protein